MRCYLAPVVFLMLPIITSCGWVDSAGINGSAKTDTQDLLELSDQDVTLILENSSIDAQLAGSEPARLDWQWTQTDNASPDRCEGMDGFNQEIAAESLENACAVPTDCSVEITDLELDSASAFHISIPALKAPVALEYQLMANDSSGLSYSRAQFFCAIAINEAPDIGDDELLVLQEETRFSEADDSDAILANDKDDIDALNQPLSIDLSTVQVPSYAAEFSIRSDGSFIYGVNEELLPENQLPAIDQFTYEVTDGVHSVQTTTRLRIVEENLPPERIQPLGVATIRVDESATSERSIQLNDFFSDPDGDRLYFSIDHDSLPDGIQSSLSDSGLMSISTDASAIGQWLLSVTATDGLLSSQSSLYLIVYQ